MRLSAVDKLFVNFVGKHYNVVAHANFCNLADFFFRINCARGVARAVEDEHFGLFGDCRFNLSRRNLVAVAGGCVYVAGNAAATFNDFRIGEPIGFGY